MRKISVFSLDPAAFKWDFAKLPEPIRLAWLNHPPNSNLVRLTESHFAFRARSGSGVWAIGTMEELIPIINLLPLPEPYTPPRPSSAKSDPLDLSNLIITLDL